MVCLEALFNNKDTFAVLPTGYAKSLLYKVLPVLLAERNTRLVLIQSGKKNETSGSCSSIVLVVCRINSLIDDQLRKINERSDLSATALKVNVDEEVCFSRDIEDATFDIVFLHPEACLSSNCGFKVAPYSLVQFINYLYRSATSDVILTTFAWNFRGSANILKQAAESCF